MIEFLTKKLKKNLNIEILNIKKMTMLNLKIIKIIPLMVLLYFYLKEKFIT